MLINSLHMSSCSMLNMVYQYSAQAEFHVQTPDKYASPVCNFNNGEHYFDVGFIVRFSECSQGCYAEYIWEIQIQSDIQADEYN